MVKVTAIKINSLYTKMIFFILLGFCTLLLIINSKSTIINIVRSADSDLFIKIFENTLTLNKNQPKWLSKSFQFKKAIESLNNFIGINVNNPQTILQSELRFLKTNKNMPILPESLIDYDENREEEDEKPEIEPIQNIVDSRGIRIINETKYNIDIKEFIEKTLKFDNLKNKPKVLIYHTHSCESYSPSDKYNYVPSDNDRTTDLNYTVVRVGEELSRILEEQYDIKVIHDKTIHDRDEYDRAYTKSADTIQSHIEKYDKFNFIIDIHRDALNVNNQKLNVSTNINDKSTAKIMAIVGTDSRGVPHPNWNENLNLSVKFIDKMNELYPGLSRGINLKLGRFNQYLSPNAMLLEVGGNGNTLDDALNSAECIAKIISELLKNS